MPPTPTIATYLIHRLQALGARHVFGVPGDYVLGLYKALEDSGKGPILSTNQK